MSDFYVTYSEGPRYIDGVNMTLTPMPASLPSNGKRSTNPCRNWTAAATSPDKKQGWWSAMTNPITVLSLPAVALGCALAALLTPTTKPS